ncbi:glycosyltransferase family 25 protein [Undibacterium squillarum]|uniref:Glycosyl transferase family 25 domain-containing protein n=1 Tax=Undibacterium squillarum TaxID=1131567 RepID=A0ABQ2XY42_9BURK|nr:glycosyltransferase family 25 protein [Undibacterium squillarum]GGX36544.1 hypothetical protein GCM10010946_12960 [Undibacterium squillarum]
MNLFDYFEKIYLINLPERTDRLKYSLAELKKIGISAQDRRLQVFPGIRPENAERFPGIGARGCYLSHLGVLKDAQKLGVSRFLILEDDFQLCPSALLSQMALIEQIEQTSWDFLFPGHSHPGHRQNTSAAESSLLKCALPLECAHCYAISPHLLPELITYLEACMQRMPGDPNGGPMHIDGAYSLYRLLHPELRSYVVTSSLVRQRSSRSDITPNQWYDKVTGIKQCAAAFRALKNWQWQLREK